MLRRLRTLVAALVVGLAVGFLVAGCSSAPSAPQVTPQQALDKARSTLATAKFVTMALTSSGVPEGRNGVTAATGTGEVSAAAPKFQGTITGTVNGLKGNIDIICITDKAWWKFFTPNYTPADLASLGAPNAAAFFHPDSGLTSVLAATTDLTAKGKARLGSEVLTSYAGHVPSAPITSLLHLGEGAAPFEVTYGLTDAGEVRQAVLTGAFFAGSISTYTVTLTDYGKAATITAPS